ncbi:MAG: N-acetyltransferase [Bauldia sp.]|uniref:GNAT family N-acetyltransferase n=1 Tax=Bauldia sp. TaxID=2575872 RepID=UPI001D5E8C73|nr:GNAT family N-acetyltransferase [Bauldia sp.]MCB1497173.1 N-acetyltransferase [Bauldia sp.]
MTMPNLRPVGSQDVPAITAIYGDAVLTGTASFEIEPPGEAEMDRRISSLVESGFPVLVAEEAGEVLGYAYAGPYRLRPAYRFTVEDTVYVAASARGRGVGRALLRRLVEDSESLNFRQMVAVIGDSAHAASIGLHRAEGFALVGTLASVGYKFGRWLDSVLMQRPLGPGDTTSPTR